LDSHIQALRDIKELWPSALAGLQDYISESPNVVRANAQDSLNAMKLAVAGQASQTERNAAQYITNFASAGSSATSVREFTQAIQELHSSIATGNPNLLQFRDHMAKIIVALDTSENEKGLAKTLFEMPDDVIKGAKAIPVLESALANMGDTSARSAAQLKTFTDAAHELANIGLPNMTDAQRALKAYNDGMANASGVRERMSIKHLYDEFERRRLLNNPQTAANDNSYSDSMQNLRSIGLPPLSELDQARKIYERAKSLATTREAKDDALQAFKDAQFRIENPQMSADQWRDLMSGADDKVEALKQEATALGKTGVEAQALRFQLDLLQKAEEKGRTASADQKEEINKKTDLFRQYATALAKAKLNQDLLNERQQILRSPQDQQIATRLQQAGLPVDLNSSEAQMMRQNADLADLKSNVHAFATDFREALLNNGGDIGDAFASALKNALMNKLADIFDKSIENMLNAVLSELGQNFSIGQSSTALTSQSQSGSLINGLVSAVVGGVKTAGASIGVAANSIGSSSSISLANARAAIASIESGGNFGALRSINEIWRSRKRCLSGHGE